MAGHSKWANIKHAKAREDSKRGKVFTKLTRKLIAAVSLGGPDPDANPRLRAAIKEALGSNMTRKQVDSAVKRAAGDGDSGEMIESRYEGYGTGGIAIIIDCLGDNKNRMVAEVRHTLTKGGGNLGTAGSVAYLFQERGVLCYAPGIDEDALMEAALEAGADDVNSHDDGSMEVYTVATDFDAVKDALTEAAFEPHRADVTWLPETSIEVDTDTGVKVLRLLDALEDLDDVQKVYSNADISEESYEEFNT